MCGYYDVWEACCICNKRLRFLKTKDVPCSKATKGFASCEKGADFMEKNKHELTENEKMAIFGCAETEDSKCDGEECSGWDNVRENGPGCLFSLTCEIVGPN